MKYLTEQFDLSQGYLPGTFAYASVIKASPGRRNGPRYVYADRYIYMYYGKSRTRGGSHIRNQKNGDDR